MSTAALDELRRLARAMVEPACQAGEAAEAFAHVLSYMEGAITPEIMADPVICEAMGQIGKAVKMADDVVRLHANALLLGLPILSPDVKRRAIEALAHGCEIARGPCPCTGCTAARAAADAAVARARAAARGPA